MGLIKSGAKLKGRQVSLTSGRRGSNAAFVLFCTVDTGACESDRGLQADSAMGVASLVAVVDGRGFDDDVS